MWLGFKLKSVQLQSPGGCSLHTEAAGSGTSLCDAQTGSPPRLDKVSFNTEILGHSSKHMGKHSGHLFIQRSASEVYLRGLEGTSSPDTVIHLEER